ncbi:hypothetical protein RUM43_000880 [Polyplax serrata]|uniref:Uncharacterized protein n=1 Tax=Polyplax serrata TaxID=468196 RepID=A0AAN8SD11_POLSC
MQECDYYIDSEEDEVFFGCVQEKEKIISCNILNNSGKYSDSLTIYLRLVSSSLGTICDGPETEDITRKTDLNISEKELENSIENDEEFYSIHSNNTSIELDHNYSYMKKKIDKSILSTPKSVVKADKDGGFLKVLSEIALVKAEADNKLEDGKGDEIINAVNKKEDEENKENEVYPLPEIKITEPTPEKPCVPFYPSPNVNTKSRKLRLIFNSASKAFDQNQKNKAKSFTESYDSIKNKSGDYRNEDKRIFESHKEQHNTSENSKKSRGNSWPNTKEIHKLNLVELPDEVHNNSDKTESICREKEESLLLKETGNENNIFTEKKILPIDGNELIVFTPIKTSNLENEKIKEPAAENKEIIILSPVNNNDKNGEDLKIQDLLTNDDIATPASAEMVPEHKSEANENQLNDIQENITAIKLLEIETNDEPCKTSVNNNESESKNEIPPKYRFSKEVKELVEALKTSVADDTLNFTIPEINLDQMENSLILHETISGLDDTVVEKNADVLSSVNAMKTPVALTSQLKKTQSKSLGKAQFKNTPVMFEGRQVVNKSTSDRKIQLTVASGIKKCAKRLPMTENISSTQMKDKQSNDKKVSAIPTRIPVYGLKPSKVPSTCVTPRSGPSHISGYKDNNVSKNAVNKTPSSTNSNAAKTAKFKNVASPIGAYIHSKQTALLVNVKPQVKKEIFVNMLKSEVNNSSRKEIPSRTPSKDLGLPFVEYKTATPFKVEKRPESRLPRLAPSVQKLIGVNSPRILKHQGRFYMKTPVAKQTSGHETILTDHNEVSLVISQFAQKSNSIK